MVIDKSKVTREAQTLPPTSQQPVSGVPPAGHVLVVDDEPGARSALQDVLSSNGYSVQSVHDGAEALTRVDASPFDLILTDLRMPRLSGIDLLLELRRRGHNVPVIVFTSASEVSQAVAAMRAGAADYLTKPLNIDELLVAMERAMRQQRVILENQQLHRQLREDVGEGLQGLLGSSEVMQELYGLVSKVAPSNASVLITGESGTGKGELARAIHALSRRSAAPFISVHCAALAESILESELFGHERGAFTGADRRRIGRFEQAHGGTLFLDEIGEIPLSVQVKLLRVLQERRVERVGSNTPIDVDVRVVAATNRDLTAAISDGGFREDLYYRLNVVRLEMPPLRARQGDLFVLAEHFLKRYADENHKSVRGFSARARTKLRAHDWPGNVRELENAIERAVVLCNAPLIDAEHLPDAPSTRARLNAGGLQIPGATLSDIERYAILKTLEAVGGSTIRAAEVLDMSVRTIQYRLHQYGLSKTRGRPPSDPPPSG